MNHFKMDLRLFDAGANVNTTVGYVDANAGTVTPYTEQNGLSEEMKTYYSDYLIDNAEPKLIHDQFAQKIPLPRGCGKTVQFRKYDPLPKLTESLVEGVTPNGQSLNMSTVEATVHQYGGYVELSDLLLLTAIDNNLLMATKLLGAQAGRTLDTITREVLCGGTNVQYGAGEVSSRDLLVGGQAQGNHYLTVDCIKRAVRTLKRQNAEKINGAYACIIHPDCAYDLTNDLNWKYPYQYAATHQLYEGEIGMIEGVRFVESTEAKIFYGASETTPGGEVMSSVYFDYQTSHLDEATHGETTQYRIKIADTISGEGVVIDPTWVGKTIFINSESAGECISAYICGVDCNPDGEQFIYLKEALRDSKGNAVTTSSKDTFMLSSGSGRDVYATIVLGENAYGVTELAGGGLQHIVKQLGSGGTADPLDQRATVGWKATKAAVRLMEPFMVRIETASSFESNEI